MTSVLLETFGEPEPTAPISKEAIDEAYQNGLIEGQRLASQTAQSELNTSTLEVQQILSDLSFTFAEAEAALLANLKPLFDALLNHIVPASKDHTLRLHILELLESEATNLTHGRASIKVPQLSGLTEDQLKACSDGCEIELCMSPGMPAGQAEVTIGPNSYTFDHTHLQNRILDAFEAITFTQKEAAS